MAIDRRLLLQALASAPMFGPVLGSAFGSLLDPAEANAQTTPPAAASTPPPTGAEAHDSMTTIPGMKMFGDEQIAMLLYPGFTALDLVGPHFFFGCLMGATVHLVTNQEDLKPVASDLGLAIVPTVRMADCPKGISVLFLPGGGAGTLAAMEHAATRTFVRERAATAQYVTSVCTGAMILAAAGLLEGKRATTHWAARPALADFGAIPVDERVVTDGKFVTGAGISAGLDFALTLVAALRGRPYAEAVMLQAEYAPQPPFPGGTLAKTDPVIAAQMSAMLSPFADSARAIAKKLRG